MRRTTLSLSILALAVTLPAMPVSAMKESSKNSKACEILNSTVDLAAMPPTMLLEGDLCKPGKEPSVWLSKEGTPTPVPVLSSGDTSILVDVTGFEFVQGARTWVVCGNGALASGCKMDLLVKAPAPAPIDFEVVTEDGSEACCPVNKTVTGGGCWCPAQAYGAGDRMTRPLVKPGASCWECSCGPFDAVPGFVPKTYAICAGVN